MNKNMSHLACPHCGMVRHVTSIMQYDLDGNFIKEFESSVLAAESVNGSSGNIRSCARGDYKTSYGFIWKYKNETT